MGRKVMTHVKGFKVFPDLGDKLLAALIAFREAFI
jgi:hypothetical protein